MWPRRQSSDDRGSGPLTLDTAHGGALVRVVHIGGDRRLAHRLAALGLVPGSTVTVTRPRGPAIVAVGAARIAIGRQAARVIEVERILE
ncbi:ferrous iron transport protein A [bacterium]|nr:ferrous iron transport protein A [bacterium]